VSTQTIKILIAGALFVHGIGHSLGYWMPANSWLLKGLGVSALRAISSIFWALSIVGFLAACLGFWGILIPFTWWQPLAIGTSVFSLLGLILFIGSWPGFNTIGAIGMNIAILVTQLWLNWPPAGMFDH
jgi:hypothetical protein